LSRGVYHAAPVVSLKASVLVTANNKGEFDAESWFERAHAGLFSSCGKPKSTVPELSCGVELR